MIRGEFFVASEDSDDDNAGLLRQALPVSPLPKDFDPTIPPSTAEEFLQHVVYERMQIPSIAVARTIKSTKSNVECSLDIRGQEINVLASPLAPDEAWKEEQLSLFAKLRNKALALRLANARNIPKIKVPNSVDDSEKWSNFMELNEPRLSVVLQMSQLQIERALQVLLKKANKTCLTSKQGNWVYAICVCLEHPLSREACGDLRDMARRFAQIRDSGAEWNDCDLAMMNLIITIVVDYFRQRDLVED